VGSNNPFASDAGWIDDGTQPPRDLTSWRELSDLDDALWREGCGPPNHKMLGTSRNAIGVGRLSRSALAKTYGKKNPTGNSHSL